MRKILYLSLIPLFAISCEKQDMPGNSIRCNAYIDGAYNTKGIEITTSGLNTSGQTFKLDAWLEATGRGTAEPKLNDDPHYLKGKEMTLSGEEWKGGSDCTWVNQVWTNFWAVYPKAPTGMENMVWPATPKTISNAQEKTPQFTYDMSSYSSGKTASESTQDILVSYARGYWDSKSPTGTALKFKFKHVLSGIRFTRGEIDTGCNITEIKIGGLHLKGTCSLTGSTVGGKDSLKFEWAGTDVADKAVGLAQTIDATSVAVGKSITGTNLMYVIPQTMSDITTLSAVVYNGSEYLNLEVELSGYSWKPGARYDYNLSYYKDKNELTVTVSEYSVSDGTWTN